MDTKSRFKVAYYVLGILVSLAIIAASVPLTVYLIQEKDRAGEVYSATASSATTARDTTSTTTTARDTTSTTTTARDTASTTTTARSTATTTVATDSNYSTTTGTFTTTATLHTTEVKGDVKWPEVPSDAKNRYRYASVACAEKNCSQIGVQMMAEGGSVADAAIATSLCLGITRSCSSGIGGGAFLTFYNRTAEKTYTLNFRETAPYAANATMYSGNSSINSKFGGGSIGVPGELAGLWNTHQRFGKLPWSKLFEPSIQLAEEGIVLNEYVFSLLKKSYSSFNNELKEVFTNNATGEMKKVGDTVVFKKLAETYRRIARDGVDTYYKGNLTDDIMADLQELDGSIITADDLRDYRAVTTEPVKGTLRNGEYTMWSAPPPSSGIVMQYILRILDGYNFTKDSVSPKMEDISSTATTYHRIVEAMKFAYAMRSNLGDAAFSNLTEYMDNMTDVGFADYIRSKISDNHTLNVEDYGETLADSRLTNGTSQISVIAGNGDALSMTTSVNSLWGSKRMGRRTGIVFNNHMDDFSRPGAPSWTDDAWTAPSNSRNWIEPGKRPLSAMSPSVFLDKNGDVVLVSGGSGGSKITAAVATTAINNLWLGMDLTEAVSRPRLHHQLLPEHILVEEGFPQEYLDVLLEKGHKLAPNTFPPVTDSVGKKDGVVFGVGDFRRQGVSDGF